MPLKFHVGTDTLLVLGEGPGGGRATEARHPQTHTHTQRAVMIYYGYRMTNVAATLFFDH